MWLSIDGDRTQWMQARVQKALRLAVGDMYRVVPREEVRDGRWPSAPPFFVPDANYLNTPGISPTPATMPSLAYDPSLRGARLIVYRDVLINLSQDSQVPSFFQPRAVHPRGSVGWGTGTTYPAPPRSSSQ